MKRLNNQTDVVLVEDDPDLRQLLLEELWDCDLTAVGADCVEAAGVMIEKHRPALVVSDLRLPDGLGTELLQNCRQLSPPPAFIMITAFGTVDQAVDALKLGAYDFLTKPLDLEHLRLAVTRALETQRLRNEVAYYRQFVEDTHFHGMVGQSHVMRRLFSQINQLAQTEGPVLITGESGTGKELVARAIHQESARRECPFVAINCGGLPASLLESELFGHVSGAFTGAKKRTGLFTSADSGTLLLDEIGEMPLEMQASLLRTLEDGRVRPVGSDREQLLDVRIIAATNRDLSLAVQEGKFREDLYYRLETFSLEVPALRHREGDIERLVAHLIGHLNHRLDRQVEGITPEALQLVTQYSFPGNVRELTNIIERAVTFCQESLIAPQDLPERVQQSKAPATLPWQPDQDGGALPSLDAVEKAYVRHVMESVKGNKSQAAEILGIGRRTLYRWLGDE